MRSRSSLARSASGTTTSSAAPSRSHCSRRSSTTPGPGRETLHQPPRPGAGRQLTTSNRPLHNKEPRGRDAEPADSFPSSSVSVLLMRSELMSVQLLSRARDGDELAFRELTDPFRRELELHCYRILGPLQDAEDMLQRTPLAAGLGLGEFQGRASLRPWLYRIATNRCLNLLRSNARRPAKEVPPMPEPTPPTRLSEPLWLQPYPDTRLEGLPDTAPGPDARHERNEAI